MVVTGDRWPLLSEIYLCGSDERRAMTAARLRLALVLAVVAMCSMNLDVFFIIFGVCCTTMYEDDRSDVSLKKV